MTYQPLSPALLGVLALHGQIPAVVGIYGDLQTPLEGPQHRPGHRPPHPLGAGGPVAREHLAL